ncbi:MAG: hypothetical protein WC162_00660 [Sphaerochaetaceae bacterium]|nr:hypothetical protein [Sphaerochaetaceae bacterium]
MFKTRKITPFAFCVFSLVYIFYVVQLGDSRMLGDSIGGDPGGRIIPLVLGIFMFISSFYIWLTDKKVKDENVENKLNTVEKHLLILTIVLSLLYVSTARIFGFILSTSLLIYILTFANLTLGLQKSNLKAFFSGAIISEIILIAVYTAGRKLTRFLLINGRKQLIPAWLGSSVATLLLTILLVSVLFFIFNILINKIFKNKNLFTQVKMSGAISVLTTEFLYLMFKQFFLVELIKGIIYW